MRQIPWYHKTTIYQIYPRSFYDTNGDGIGDLRGIIQKLDYIQELGFETIWISPFFSSPQADFGYDISNYTDIAPEYGAMSDAIELIDQVHQRGMKIVFDMVMNHTSDQHPWFKESSSSRDNPKSDWYIWKDSHLPKGDEPGVRAKPNNWQSLTGGSGWHFSKEREQYYWSSFLPFQPDLNYRNPEVKKAMLDIVRFWLAKGADGYRLDIFNVIYKDTDFKDNPFIFKLIPTEDDPSGFFQQAKYSMNLPESFSFAKEFRNVCDEFGEKLSVGEVSGNRQTIRKFLGDETNNGLTLVFDFGMLNFKFTADYFRELIRTMEENYPEPFAPVYVFSNHDRTRSIKKLGNDEQKAKLLAMFQLTVRGVPCMYYGEEIGMTDARISFGDALDPVPHKFKFLSRFIFDALGLMLNRDEVRTPMQWNDAKNSGFSSAEKTWLAVHPNFASVNVEREKSEPDSLLNTIQALLKIRRQENALQDGSLEILGNLPTGILGYSRKFGDEKIFVFLNFSGEEKTFAFDNGNCIFKLSNDNFSAGKVQLQSFGGMILK